MNCNGLELMNFSSGPALGFLIHRNQPSNMDHIQERCHRATGECWSSHRLTKQFQHFQHSHCLTLKQEVELNHYPLQEYRNFSLQGTQKDPITVETALTDP